VRRSIAAIGELEIRRLQYTVMPAQAGIREWQLGGKQQNLPAFAGTTKETVDFEPVPMTQVAGLK